MSMQEEQARRDAATSDVPSAQETNTSVDPSAPSGVRVATSEADMDDDDEEAQLAAALALSQGEDVVMADEEEDEIQHAIRLTNTEPDDEAGKK